MNEREEFIANLLYFNFLRIYFELQALLKKVFKKLFSKKTYPQCLGVKIKSHPFRGGFT